MQSDMNNENQNEFIFFLSSFMMCGLRGSSNIIIRFNQQLSKATESKSCGSINHAHLSTQIIKTLWN